MKRKLRNSILVCLPVFVMMLFFAGLTTVHASVSLTSGVWVEGDTLNGSDLTYTYTLPDDGAFYYEVVPYEGFQYLSNNRIKKLSGAFFVTVTLTADNEKITNLSAYRNTTSSQGGYISEAYEYNQGTQISIRIDRKRSDFRILFKVRITFFPKNSVTKQLIPGEWFSGETFRDIRRYFTYTLPEKGTVSYELYPAAYYYRDGIKTESPLYPIFCTISTVNGRQLVYAGNGSRGSYKLQKGATIVISVYDRKANEDWKTPFKIRLNFTPDENTDLSSAAISLSASSYTYDGSSKKPVPTVTINGKTLISGKDYTASYSNNTNAGTASVTVKGKGTYKGSKTVSFTINPASLRNATVTLSKTSYTCDGKEKKPSVTVKLNKKTLKKNTDYTVTYSDNKEIGKASVVIIGTNNYKGTRTLHFTIRPAKVKSIVLTNTGAGRVQVEPAIVAKAGYYEIWYSRQSSFSSKKAVCTPKNSSVVTVSGLDTNQRYYFKARALKISGNTIYRGDWSSTKSITTKNASISLNKSKHTIVTPNYKNVTLKATVKGKSNKVKWVSSNTHVATVKDGVVTAVANSGISIISATANGVTAQCTINVQNWKYETKTLTFKTFSEWKTEIVNAEKSLFPIHQLIIDPVSGNNKGDVFLVTGKKVLETKTVIEKIKIAGETKKIAITCPSKIKYEVRCHIHDFVGKNSLAFRIGNGGIILSQTCRCGYRSEWTWELPSPTDPGEGWGGRTVKDAVDYSYNITARCKYDGKK